MEQSRGHADDICYVDRSSLFSWLWLSLGNQLAISNNKTLANDNSSRGVDESILVVDVMCPNQILKVRRVL